MWNLLARERYPKSVQSRKLTGFARPSDGAALRGRPCICRHLFNPHAWRPFALQAQYLQRIRIPHWSNVPKALRQILIASVFSGDRFVCNDAVASLYKLSADEMT